MTRFVGRWIKSLVALVILVPIGLQPVLAQELPAWPHENSDLPVDPDVRYGRLDNGMGYILMFNDTPPGEASLKLHFDTGSLNEADDQRGFAHFLEHMAFNGSQNVPEGEMIKILERFGLEFGPDTNAFTSFDQTAYLLELPDTSDALVDQALFLMRETAGNLSLDPDAIDRERGVILSEYRARNTPGFRFIKELNDFVAPETIVAERMPIGTVDNLKEGEAARLRDYYERYYRPEAAVLVLVGDLDLDRAEAKIVELFGDWEAQTPPRPDPEKGKLVAFDQIRVNHHFDESLPTQILLTATVAKPDEPDTIENRQKALLRQVANGIFNRRMAALARSEDSAINGGSASFQRYFDYGEQALVFVSSENTRWEEGLATGITEWRRALQFGFTQAEIDEQLANLKTALENAVRGAETRDTGALATALMNAQFSGAVFTTPENNLERFEEFKDQITPDALLAAFREQWDETAPAVMVAGNIVLDDPQTAISEVVNAALQAPVEPPEDQEAMPWAYDDFGVAGEVVSEVDHGDPEYTTVVFNNNVMLNLKKTDFEDNRIRASVRVGGGQLSLTGEDAPLGLLISFGLPAGGLEAHSSDEIQRILAGRTVGGQFGVGEDAFAASSVTTPDDLLLQLQLWAAYMTAPGYRAEGQAQFRRLFSTVYDAQFGTPGGVMNAVGSRLIRRGDPRFGLPPLDTIMALSFDQARDALTEPLANSAIQITLVGDLDKQAAIEAVANTFGALPTREARPRTYDEGRDLKFAEPGEVTLAHKGPEDQALVRIYWPTTDFSDPVVSRKLDLLFRVMDLRVTDQAREALGATYSGQVGNVESNVFPGFGYGLAGADVNIDDVDTMLELINGIAAKLASETITEDELTRARQPLLEQLESRLTDNGFWLGLLDTAQTKPELIDITLNAGEVYKAITVDDLNALAQTYLTPETSFTIKVLPEELVDTAEGGTQ